MNDILEEAKQRFADAQDAFREQRERMIADLKFSNPTAPEQWDDKARQIRENGPNGARPCLTLDHTNQYLAQVVNDGRQNKPAIDYMPSSGGARAEVAEALNGIAKHIEYQSRAQIAYDTSLDHAARIGLGWIRVLPEMVDPALNYQEIRIKRVHDPLSVLADPDWTEPDGSDISWAFVTTLMTKKAVKKRWPKADASTWSTDDIQRGWASGEMIRVCEYFERIEIKTNRLIVRGEDGIRRTLTEDEYWQQAKETGVRPQLEGQYSATDYKVIWRTMTGAEILEETEFPCCYIPLVPVIGDELWVDGKRYLSGMVRRMMEAQRAYNYERSAFVEAVALQPKAPFLASAESIEGHENEWAQANRANLAYLPFNAYDDQGNALPQPSRAAPPAFPAAFAQGAQIADADIQASVGIYKANLGAPSNEKSGRAILARQREGDTANFHYIDNLSRSIERLGRIVLDMIVRLYDEPRESRILGDDGTTKPVKIDPTGSVYAIDGDMTTINPSTGTYDVRVKAGPSYTTLRQEAAEGLTQMMQGNPGVAAVVAPIWARMQDWPEADKLSKALLAMAPPPVQQALGDQEQQTTEALQQQLQALEQQAQQMQMMLEQAAQKIQELQADEKRTTLEYLAKAAEIELKEYDAETKRLQVMGATITPEQVAALTQQLVQQALTREPLGDGEHLEHVVLAQAGMPDADPYGQGMEMDTGGPPEPMEPQEPMESMGMEDEAPEGAFSLGESEPVE